jgi:hypothetical protein
MEPQGSGAVLRSLDGALMGVQVKGTCSTWTATPPSKYSSPDTGPAAPLPSWSSCSTGSMRWSAWYLAVGASTDQPAITTRSRVIWRTPAEKFAHSGSRHGRLLTSLQICTASCLLMG